MLFGSVDEMRHHTFVFGVTLSIRVEAQLRVALPPATNQGFLWASPSNGRIHIRQTVKPDDGSGGALMTMQTGSLSVPYGGCPPCDQVHDPLAASTVPLCTANGLQMDSVIIREAPRRSALLYKAALLKKNFNGAYRPSYIMYYYNSTTDTDKNKFYKRSQSMA